MGTLKLLAATFGVALGAWTLTATAQTEGNEGKAPDRGAAEDGKQGRRGAEKAKRGKRGGRGADGKATSKAGKLEERRETRKRFRDKQTDSSEEGLKKRRERLERAAKNLGDKATSLREEAKGQTDQEAAKRLSEKADKFDAQAKRLRDKAAGKDVGRPPKAGRKRIRAARQAQLRSRWGDAVLSSPDAKAELKLHAERAAKLKQIRRVARKANKDDAGKRALELLARERQRHQQRMEAIRAATPNAKPAPEKATAAAPAQTQETSK